MTEENNVEDTIAAEAVTRLSSKVVSTLGIGKSKANRNAVRELVKALGDNYSISSKEDLYNAVAEKFGTQYVEELNEEIAGARSYLKEVKSDSSQQIVTGTFTLDANANQPIITHNCGFVPSFFIVYPIDEIVLGDRRAIGCVIVNVNEFNELNVEKQPHFVWECQDATTAWYGASTGVGELTETTAKLCYRSGTYNWKTGFQYGWTAIE